MSQGRIAFRPPASSGNDAKASRSRAPAIGCLGAAPSVSIPQSWQTSGFRPPLAFACPRTPWWLQTPAAFILEENRKDPQSGWSCGLIRGPLHSCPGPAPASGPFPRSLGARQFCCRRSSMCSTAGGCTSSTGGGQAGCGHSIGNFAQPPDCVAVLTAGNCRRDHLGVEPINKFVCSP